MPEPQLPLFHVPRPIPGFHRVSAHTRVLADGTPVLVAEHLRWNPAGSSAPRPATPRGGSKDTDPAQLPLFSRGTDPSAAPPPARPPG